MKKLTRKSLDELAKTFPVIDQSFQMSYVGGGDGTSINPYNRYEFDCMVSAGTWKGGYVEGWGYTSGDVMITPDGNYTTRGAYAASLAGSYAGLSETANWDKIKDLWPISGSGYPNPDPNTPWCAMFVSAIFNKAGISNPCSAAVDSWRNWGNATYTPAVGDIAIWNSSSHIGIVTSVDGDNVTVISGNYSNQVGYATMSKSSFMFRTR